MIANGSIRRDPTPLPAMAAVLVAVLAISVAATADPGGHRSGRSLQLGPLGALGALGSMLVCVDGAALVGAFDAERRGDPTLPHALRSSDTGEPRADHARLVAPSLASGPGRADLPPPVAG